jgi:hypothetical protein
MQRDDYRGYNAYLIERNGRRILFGGDTAFTNQFVEVGNTDLSIWRFFPSLPTIRGSGRTPIPSKLFGWQTTRACALSCRFITKHSVSASSHSGNRLNGSKRRCATNRTGSRYAKSAKPLSSRNSGCLSGTLGDVIFPPRADVAQLVEQRFRKP